MRTNTLPILGIAAAAALSVTIAHAQIVNLSSGNSTASVNLGSQAGMYSWTVNGVNQLNQQWFWYRIDGQTTGQQSIDTIGGLTYSPSGNYLDATYTAAYFSVEITYTLQGGATGGNDWTSDIMESIDISNTGTTNLNFHFFQYSDFQLGGSSGNETASIFQNGQGFTKATVLKGGSQVSETIDQPLANEAEADLATNTRNRLNSGSAYTLNGNLNSGPDPNLDATWALEWDFSIAPGTDVEVLKDKKLSVAPIPEPGVLVLMALGMGGVSFFRTRKKQ